MDVFLEQKLSREICRPGWNGRKLKLSKEDLNKFLVWVHDQRSKKADSGTVRAADHWLASLCILATPELMLPEGFTEILMGSNLVEKVWKKSAAAAFVRRARAKTFLYFMETLKWQVGEPWEFENASVRVENKGDVFYFGKPSHSFNSNINLKDLHPAKSDLEAVKNNGRKNASHFFLRGSADKKR